MNDDFAIPKSRLREAQVKYFVLTYFTSDAKNVFDKLVDFKKDTHKFSLPMGFSYDYSVLMLCTYFENYGYTVIEKREGILDVSLTIY